MESDIVKKHKSDNPKPTDFWYSYVRRGNFIIQYRDYVLGYMDGQTDEDDCVKFCAGVFLMNDDIYYWRGYCDGYYKHPVKRDVDI